MIFFPYLLAYLSTVLSAPIADAPFTVAIPRSPHPTLSGGYASFPQPLSSVPGKPALPTVRLCVLVGPDADLETLRISALDTVGSTLDGEFLVRPAPPISHLDNSGPFPVFVPSWPEGMVVVDGKDMAVYGANNWYPGERLQVQTGMLGQYKLVDVFLSPFAYNPVTRKLRVLTSGRIRVSYTPQPDFIPATSTRTPRYEQSLVGLIANDSSVFQLYGALPPVAVAPRASSPRTSFEGLLPVRSGTVQMPRRFGGATCQVRVHRLDGTRLFTGAVHSSTVRLPAADDLDLVFVRVTPLLHD